MGDPNFPPNLAIKPLHLDSSSGDQIDAWKQDEAIQRYGIAGRVWHVLPISADMTSVTSHEKLMTREATELLVQYLSPTSQSSAIFDPPCPIFTNDKYEPKCIIELGSGQSVASLHLASLLQPADSVVLTDLDDVMPLCNQSVASKRASVVAQIKTAPLAWGSSTAQVKTFGPFTHIVMCDLASQSCSILLTVDLLSRAIRSTSLHSTRSNGAELPF